jgi:hypothetical protein
MLCLKERSASVLLPMHDALRRRWVSQTAEQPGLAGKGWLARWMSPTWRRNRSVTTHGLPKGSVTFIIDRIGESRA